MLQQRLPWRPSGWILRRAPKPLGLKEHVNRFRQIRGVPWHLDFARRAGRHAQVVVPAVRGLSSDDQRALAQSLSTFQLGESGTGEHLFSAAHQAGTTTRYRDALALFVAEEQEHARLLALVLNQLEYPLKKSHWTDRVFVVLRQIKSLRSEVLTLLVAELVALTYYATLRDGIPELADVFGRIHDDEVRHINFHADTLPTHIAKWPAFIRATVRVLWNLLVIGSSIVVAIDHRGALRAAGIGPLTFVRRVSMDLRELDGRLFG